MNRSYKTTYDTSRALVVGISDYANVSPLENAASDAESLARTLEVCCGFDAVERLINDRATRRNILDAFYAMGNRSKPDDRMVVFFAGHGVSSSNGSRGFLVPFDAEPGNQSSLIRWEELRLGIEDFRAKHTFLLIDACFSGLALTRLLPEGTVRDLRRSLLSRSVQVLTAGKGTQTVADLGGPLPGHSPFTGFLIQALTGGAKDQDGVIAATNVMFYVRQHVKRDLDASQTPLFGWLDGDGDLVFAAPGGLSQVMETASAPPAPALALAPAPAIADTPPSTEIHVVAKSIHSGIEVPITVRRDATVAWLVGLAARGLSLKGIVDVGAMHPLQIRWVIIDARALDGWERLDIREAIALRALVETPDGLAASVKDDDRLHDLGIDDGFVFHLYPVQEFGPAASVDASAEGPALKMPKPGSALGLNRLAAASIEIRARRVPAIPLAARPRLPTPAPAWPPRGKK